MTLRPGPNGRIERQRRDEALSEMLWGVYESVEQVRARFEHFLDRYGDVRR